MGRRVDAATSRSENIELPLAERKNFKYLVFVTSTAGFFVDGFGTLMVFPVNQFSKATLGMVDLLGSIYNNPS